MYTKKSIEFVISVCDICGKKTTRRRFLMGATFLHFCIDHKKIEEVLKNIVSTLGWRFGKIALDNWLESRDTLFLMGKKE